MTTEKKDYISLEDLLARNESSRANKKFFELLTKYKKGKRKDFIQEWNKWVETLDVEMLDNEEFILDLSEFYFDINNEEQKEFFAVLIQGNHTKYEELRDITNWNFSHLKFPNIKFDESKFIGGVTCFYTDFVGEASFSLVEFDGEVDVELSIFNYAVSFHDAKFIGEFFTDANEFKGEASFGGAKFIGKAYFGDTEFHNGINFEETEFDNEVYFDMHKVNKGKGIIYYEGIYLLGIKFNDNVYFNEEFLSQANLAEVFIDITRINFIGEIDSSRILKDPDNYRIFRRYYANKLNHELERKYFALELESKPFPKIKKIEKWPDVKNWLFYPFELIKDFGYRIITLLYKWTSDYGNSIFRPIIAVLFVYLYTILTASDLAFDTGFVDEILGKYSRILLTHIPFGYGAGDLNIYKYSNDWMKFLNSITMYLGLFLMGLAARNRFRIK